MFRLEFNGWWFISTFVVNYFRYLDGMIKYIVGKIWKVYK